MSPPVAARKLGAKGDAQTGHAGDHVESSVVAKPGLDVLVEFGDLLVEPYHLPRERMHQLSGQLLAGQADVLLFSGLDGDLGDPVRVHDMAVAQPGFQPLGADTADGGGGLVAGQQGERAGVGQVQGVTAAARKVTQRPLHDLG